MPEKDSDTPDIFLANKSYPDAKGLFFDGFQPLEQVRDTCMVVLDTNALLVPFGISKNGLSEIEATYKPLAKAKRLVVPGQVAREFAKNRPSKIGEIFQAISRRQNIASIDKGRYPLLEGTSNYEKLRDLENKINELVSVYRSAIGDLLEDIRAWNWNDPVSTLYSQVLSEAIVDLPIDENLVQKRLAYLQNNKVPPGYKDSGKLDQGVGDLLVWLVTIHVAEQSKLPIVLVGGDTKADWFYRSENQPLFPRFELVDEIRRVSGGKSLHIISFSKFLELFGATPEAVGEARTEEIKIDLSTMSPYGRVSVLAHVAEQAVVRWLEDRFPVLRIVRDDRTGDYILSETGGASSLVSVKYFLPSRHRATISMRLRDEFRRFENKEVLREFDDILVFLVFESEPDAIDVENRLPEILARIGNPNARVVVANLSRDGLLQVRDPLNALPKFE